MKIVLAQAYTRHLNRQPGTLPESSPDRMLTTRKVFGLDKDLSACPEREACVGTALGLHVHVNIQVCTDLHTCCSNLLPTGVHAFCQVQKSCVEFQVCSAIHGRDLQEYGCCHKTVKEEVKTVAV